MVLDGKEKAFEHREKAIHSDVRAHGASRALTASEQNAQRLVEQPATRGCRERAMSLFVAASWSNG